MNSLVDIFWKEGLCYIKHCESKSSLTGLRKFRTFFGVSPSVCGLLWMEIKNKISGSQTKHLLWCLLFLKAYNTEHINATIVNVDEKTFRLWVWRFIEMLSKINVVKWENRCTNMNDSKTYVSLDGTDFRIREPIPFDRKWFSHKFKAAGIRYEIGIAIESGEIVWASGGFPCGEWPDIKIAKELYVYYAENEITLADKGYRDERYFKLPQNRKEKRILARHETLNGRLKNFQVLSSRYRHPLEKHPSVFHACVNIVQVCITNGESLFEI